MSIRKHVEVSQLRNVLKICYLTALKKACRTGGTYIIFSEINEFKKFHKHISVQVSVLSTLKIILIKQKKQKLLRACEYTVSSDISSPNPQSLAVRPKQQVLSDRTIPPLQMDRSLPYQPWYLLIHQIFYITKPPFQLLFMSQT